MNAIGPDRQSTIRFVGGKLNSVPLGLRAYDFDCIGDNIIEVELLRFQFILSPQQAAEMGDDICGTLIVLLDARKYFFYLR